MDGRGNETTVLTLSHWPGAGTPAALRADSSAAIVFNFLDAPDAAAMVGGCDIASNNHFDEDGLVGLFALLYPKLAANYRDFLLDVASAGDFGVFRDVDAARISFVISAWSNPELSPLNQSVFAKPYPEVMAILYEELLVRVPNIIEKIDHLQRYWEEEDDFLSLTKAALADGVIAVEEFESLDLAIVTVDAGFPRVPRSAGASWVSNSVHPMAIHNLTERMRVLVVKENRYELYFRYETWVDYVSRKLPPRLNLSPLAARLTSQERGRAQWQYTGNDEIISRLKLVGAEMSAIAPATFIQQVKDALATV